MSDLADAVYVGQTLGHAISDPPTTAEVTHTAMTADLDSGTAIDGEHMRGTEHDMLQTKIAQSVAMHGEYNPGKIMNDNLHAYLDASLVHDFLAQNFFTIGSQLMQ